MLCALAFASLTGSGCTGVPTREAQRSWVQEGFGRRYTGDQTKGYYAGIGDRVGMQSIQYPDLQGVQEIKPDGKITVPMIGDIDVAGLTAAEIKDRIVPLLEEHGLKNAKDDLVVAIPFRASKRVFIVGFTGRVGNVILRGDTTILDVLAGVQHAALADTDDIRIYRGDPEHPECITVDLDEIRETGITRTNVQLKEDDIIYIPPTAIGRAGLILKEALSPLTIVVGAVGGIIQAALIPARLESIDQISQRISDGEGQRGGRGGTIY